MHPYLLGRESTLNQQCDEEEFCDQKISSIDEHGGNGDFD
jgi:hypothetical protein